MRRRSVNTRTPPAGSGVSVTARSRGHTSAPRAVASSQHASSSSTQWLTPPSGWNMAGWSEAGRNSGKIERASAVSRSRYGTFSAAKARDIGSTTAPRWRMPRRV